MKLAACAQTIIEIIDSILLKTHIPADSILSGYFRSHRFIGSHDRRLIAQTTYSILRYFPCLQEHHNALNGRLAFILYQHLYKNESFENVAKLFTGETYAPKPLSDQEKIFFNLPINIKKQDCLPKWLIPYLHKQHLQDCFVAMNQEAPFDLRVNTLIATRDEVMHDFFERGILTSPTPWSPYGIRISDRRPLANDPLFKKGAIEVQDEGSQLVSIMCDVLPGMSVLDMCAGAGGKTLALAAMMQNKGIIVATDVVQSRLDQCRKRLRRSRVHNVQTRLIDNTWLKKQQERFDRVVVDAPCSGTGTWRRNPDLKIRTDQKTLDELIEKQYYILNNAAPLVKPGGCLIYITCSLLPKENKDQVEYFLKEHQDFTLQPIEDIWYSKLSIPYPALDPYRLQLTTKDHYTDGFFVAVLMKNLSQ